MSIKSKYCKREYSSNFYEWGSNIRDYTSDESVTTDEKWFVCLSELHSAKVFSLNIFKNFMHFLHKKETFQRYYLDLELEASCPQRSTDFETFISKILSRSETSLEGFLEGALEGSFPRTVPRISCSINFFVF